MAVNSWNRKTMIWSVNFSTDLWIDLLKWRRKIFKFWSLEFTWTTSWYCSIYAFFNTASFLKESKGTKYTFLTRNFTQNFQKNRRIPIWIKPRNKDIWVIRLLVDTKACVDGSKRLIFLIKTTFWCPFVRMITGWLP